MWDPNDKASTTMPRSSYKQRVPVVGAEAGCGELVALWVNAPWMPYILGALQQLAQPSIWDTTDQTALALVLAQVQDLLSNIGNAALGTRVGPRPIANGNGACTWIVNRDQGLFVLNQ